jgi:hypothetical protein
MSRADNKRKVFTTISAYTSLNQERKKLKQSDIFTSVNNKSDAVPYLLDVLKCVAGTDALKETIGGMFTKLIGKVEPTLKTTLKKQFVQSNSSESLPTSFKTNGITVPVKDIDVSGKLKASPTTTEGSLLYDTSIPNFDKVAHDAIVSSGTDKPFANMFINYNATTDKLQIKPKLDIVTNPNIGDYFTNYIDSAQIIDKKEIMTKVMDGIYGTMAKKQKKTVEQAYNELQVEELLEQILNDDDSFEISPAKYDELLQKANEMAAGVVYYDMGCGQMAAELSFDDLNSLIKSISGSTDPFAVGNAIESTITQSTSGSASSAAITAENKQTIKDGFFQRVIKTLTNKLLQAVTTAPQVRVLLGMMSTLQGNGTQLGLAKDDMKNFKTCIKCMAKEIMRLVAEFIFGLAVTYLMILLKPIIKKIIKEKINQYVNIIKSLTPAGRIVGELTG